MIAAEKTSVTPAFQHWAIRYTERWRLGAMIVMQKLGWTRGGGGGGGDEAAAAEVAATDDIPGGARNRAIRSIQHP